MPPTLSVRQFVRSDFTCGCEAVMVYVKLKFIGQFEKQHEVGWADREPLLLAGL